MSAAWGRDEQKIKRSSGRELSMSDAGNDAEVFADVGNKKISVGLGVGEGWHCRGIDVAAHRKLPAWILSQHGGVGDE